MLPVAGSGGESHLPPVAIVPAHSPRRVAQTRYGSLPPRATGHSSARAQGRCVRSGRRHRCHPAPCNMVAIAVFNPRCASLVTSCTPLNPRVTNPCRNCCHAAQDTVLAVKPRWARERDVGGGQRVVVSSRAPTPDATTCAPPHIAPPSPACPPPATVGRTHAASGCSAPPRAWQGRPLCATARCRRARSALCPAHSCLIAVAPVPARHTPPPRFGGGTQGEVHRSHQQPRRSEQTDARCTRQVPQRCRPVARRQRRRDLPFQHGDAGVHIRDHRRQWCFCTCHDHGPLCQGVVLVARLLPHRHQSVAHEQTLPHFVVHGRRRCPDRGRNTVARRHKSWASRTSVFARRNRALAKWCACNGLITLTG